MTPAKEHSCFNLKKTQKGTSSYQKIPKGTTTK